MLIPPTLTLAPPPSPPPPPPPEVLTLTSTLAPPPELLPPPSLELDEPLSVLTLSVFDDESLPLFDPPPVFTEASTKLPEPLFPTLASTLTRLFDEEPPE